ncbi:nitrilase-related carbon-nitrogen hydrolase [Kiloniella sp. EL199]|uniref:nitrilase-related carbon-nitrogen hydrolase n=1 Tax=Kiloniella sp. EL199 TaxID=2107581 RepID=UPI001C1FF3B8|nr:nitrilase-related carbon-nitrogen hydrolase [Kiloniella sp. EL199]
MPLSPLNIALWAVNLETPLKSLSDWIEITSQRMEQAKEQGTDLLLMPEYVSEQWMAFAPAGIGPDEEIPWMATQATEAIDQLKVLVKAHDIALLAGTFPVAIDTKDDVSDSPVNDNSGYYNRAHLFLPDDRYITQDKLCLTPNEQDPKVWCLTPGNKIKVFTWRSLRIAILICLDIEMPALSSLIADHDIDLILVPSMTSKLAGYNRVFGCAKARAIELQAAVAAVGPIGATHFFGKKRQNQTSAAAVYIPCEESLGHIGVATEISPTDTTVGQGPLIVAKDIPFDEIRRLRSGSAEVWPGAWNADHVVVEDNEK